MKRYLDIREAASFLGFSRRTLYDWCSQRRIPHQKVLGGRLRFDVRELESFMEGFQIGVVDDGDKRGRPGNG